MPVVWIPQSYSSMHTYKRNGIASSKIGFRAIPIPIPCQTAQALFCVLDFNSFFLIFEIRVVPLVCMCVCVPNVRFFLIFIYRLIIEKAYIHTQGLKGVVTRAA